jgi:hypothetical protein
MDPDVFNPRGQLAVGFELRLREYLVWLPAASGTGFRAVHAPQVVFHLVATSATAPHGLPAGPRLSSFDAELQLGAFIVQGDGQVDASLLLGGGFAFYLPL